MQVRRLFHGVKGAARLAKYASLWEHAMTDEANRRINILSFWEKHGLQATLDAFSTKRRTLFLWKATLKKAQGDVEALNPRSKRPRTRNAAGSGPLSYSPRSSACDKTTPTWGKKKSFICSSPGACRRGSPAAGCKPTCRVLMFKLLILQRAQNPSSFAPPPHPTPKQIYRSAHMFSSVGCQGRPPNFQDYGRHNQNCCSTHLQSMNLPA